MTTPESARVLPKGVPSSVPVLKRTLAYGFAFAAAIIWFAPKPKGPIDMSGGH